MADDAMFAPLTPGEQPAAAVTNGKRKASEWVPMPVPDGVPLPDGKPWAEQGIAFPPHPLGRPTTCHWFRNEAGQVVCGECRFEFDLAADTNDKADANAAQPDVGAPVPDTLIKSTADAAGDADSKLLSFSGAPEKKQKTYRPLVYSRRRDDDPVCGWRWQGLQKPYPLFDLARLIGERDRPVLITEGARKAVTAAGLFPDFAPTAMLFGAEAPAKSDYSPLAGREVVVWPDHDAAGLEFAREVTALLKKAGAVSVGVVAIPPEFPPKWDLCDPLPDGVTVDYLRALLEAAEPIALVSDPASESRAIAEAGQDLVGNLLEDDEIARLAALSLLAYEREREPAAQRLACRVSVLDKLVAEARGGVDDTFAGHALNLPEPTPWPEPVDGAALLDGIVNATRRYMILPAGATDTLALWAVGTHAYNAFMIFPRLGITSPTKRCGKTTLLDILAAIVLRALLASNISTAAVFRTVEVAHPTLLVDEADRFLKNSDELIGVLNAGHRCGGQVIRVVETSEGYEPRVFDCYSPAALAGIGKLPDTLADRSVEIKLRRKRREERVESLRLDRMEAFEVLSQQAARWTRDNRIRLREADPAMPAALFNRVAANWRPLIAIADAAGGEWPQRARRVAEAAAAQDKDESARTMLLADLRDLFDEEPSGILFTTKEILPALTKMEDRPWPEWRKEKPLTSTQLAALLKPFGVSPGTVRRGDETGKGYRRADLEDAFARYLDEASTSQAVTPSQATDSASFNDAEAVTASKSVTARTPEKSRISAGGDAVTAQEQLSGNEEATWTA